MAFFLSQRGAGRLGQGTGAARDLRCRVLSGPVVPGGEWSQVQRMKSHKLRLQRVPRLEGARDLPSGHGPRDRSSRQDSETQHGVRESLTPRSGKGVEGDAIHLPVQFKNVC